MKAPRLLSILALTGAAAGLFAGAAALRSALSPIEWVRQALANPFGLSTRVTPSGPVVLSQVQRLQRVETCRYNEQVVVRGETAGLLPVWLAGDRMAFVGRGEVVAGMDLGRLRPEDLRVEAARVTVHLPPAEILHTRLDNRGSEVFDRRSGFLSGPDGGLETRVRIEAEDRIREAALSGGVLAAADTNARDLVRRQLEQLGFREVRFE